MPPLFFPKSHLPKHLNSNLISGMARRIFAIPWLGRVAKVSWQIYCEMPKVPFKLINFEKNLKIYHIFKHLKLLSSLLAPRSNHRQAFCLATKSQMFFAKFSLIWPGLKTHLKPMCHVVRGVAFRLSKYLSQFPS